MIRPNTVVKYGDVGLQPNYVYFIIGKVWDFPIFDELSSLMTKNIQLYGRSCLQRNELFLESNKNRNPSD